MRLIILGMCTLLLSSCAQFNILHTARTEGKGNITLTPAVSGIGFTDPGAAGGQIGQAVLPFGQLELAYGITDYLDVNANVSTSGNLLASLKFQVMGDNSSPFSLAVMPGYEHQFLYQDGQTRVTRLHIPIIASIYNENNVGLFAMPKVMIQVEEGNENTTFPGITAGIALDKRTRYRFGVGMYVPYNSTVGVQGYIYHFGMSANFLIQGRR